MTERAIIIGASHAGTQLATSLRQEGWEGEILVVGDEHHLPYHRPPLSKTFLKDEVTEQQILIRPQLFYDRQGIQFRLGSSVTDIDRAAKHIVLAGGESIPYSKLALCVGARARKVPIPGATLPGAFYLRSLDDVIAIKGRAKPGKRVVIIGGGYIGLEVAASLNRLGLAVTVLEMMARVLQRVTAADVSEFYTRVHTEEGVNIHTGVTVSSIDGAEQVQTVNCADDTSYPADLVIIGVGIQPNIELAEAAGLTVDNGIVVDEYARTADPDIVAAGDCSNHPNELLGRRLRLESVPNATEQAKTAAASLCGLDRPYRSHPWFWSDQYDMKLQIAGLNQGYDRVIIRGDHKQGRSFVAWYLQGDQLLAADCINRTAEFAVAKQLLANNIAIDPTQLADDRLDPKTLLKNRSS